LNTSYSGKHSYTTLDEDGTGQERGGMSGEDKEVVVDGLGVLETRKRQQ